MSRPKKSFEPYPDPKNSPLGPKKVKNDPIIKSKSKVKIDVSIENKSFTTSWLVPKTFFKHTSTPKIAH